MFELLVPLFLILLGLGLVAAEVYLVPGFNVVGILGFLMLIFAVGYTYATVGMAAGTLALFGAIGMGTAMGYLIWKSGAWERFVLAASIENDPKEVDRVNENRARYLGKRGLAITPLRPTGVAEIDGERVEVLTEGGFIAAGSVVRVVAMDRRRLFVRLAEGLPEPGEPTVTSESPGT